MCLFLHCRCIKVSTLFFGVSYCASRTCEHFQKSNADATIFTFEHLPYEYFHVRECWSFIKLLIYLILLELTCSKQIKFFNWSNETPFLKLSRVQKITTISNQSNFIVQSENYEYFQIGNIKWHQSSVYHLSGLVYGSGIFVHSWYFCAFTAYYCIYVSVMKCLLQNWLWWFVAKFCVCLNADKIHHKRFNK